MRVLHYLWFEHSTQLKVSHRVMFTRAFWLFGCMFGVYIQLYARQEIVSFCVNGSVHCGCEEEANLPVMFQVSWFLSIILVKIMLRQI